MGSINRSFALIFILIIAISSLSLLLVKPAFAQSIPKPSVPEFKVKYVDNSYDALPTYGEDLYTGKTVLTQSGYHVQNNSVELIITNQPYHSYSNENGSLVWLFYSIANKGHFENWSIDNWASQNLSLKTYDSYPNGYFPSSDSEHTIVTYGLAGDNGTGNHFYYGYYDYTLGNISVGGQIDFRVQAIIGYSTRINESLSGPPVGLNPGDVPHYYIFTGQTSDWSNTQTITIPASSISASPSPIISSTPTVPEFPTSIILPILVAAVLLSTLLIRKIPKNSSLFCSQ